MLVLFDHGTPKGLARALSEHTVQTAQSRGWDSLSNGELLNAAEEARFDVLLTTDRRIRYQQNPTVRRIALVVLTGSTKWSLVRRHADRIAAAVGSATPGSYVEVEKVTNPVRAQEDVMTVERHVGLALGAWIIAGVAACGAPSSLPTPPAASAPALAPSAQPPGDRTSTLQDLGRLAEGTGGPATIYVAREFITMDPKRPRAEAVAVRDGRFVAVGTRAEVEKTVGSGARTDSTFADKVAMAGFVEQHVHPLLAALTMNTTVISIEDWDTIDGFSPAVRDEQGYVERLKQALAAHTDKKTPFITWGYHHYFHGRMSRQILNDLAPDVPVIVWHRSAHELFFNDLALKLVGIDETLIKGFGKSAQDQSILGEGHFFEQGAIALLPKVAPFMASPAAFRKGLEFTKAYYHRNGITLACEPGGFLSRPIQDAVNAVYSDDATPFNHCFIGDGKSFYAIKPDDPASLLAETRKVLNWGKGRTWYLPNQVKLFTDGAIYSQLMQMKDGYTDGHHGAWIIDPPAFDFMFQTYWDAGYQIHVHNNGDAGFDVVLASLEKAMARKPRTDHRTVLVHFGFSQPDQVARWIKLGGVVSSNPYYVTALAGRYAKLGIGPERAANIAAHGDVVKNNGSLSFHSDMPMAPAKPLQLVWAAITRLTAEGDVAGPQQKVSLDVALKAITIDAAYSIQMEDRVGSIAVGKDANLTILAKSPYDVAPTEVKHIVVWGTMLEGRVQPAPAAPRAASTIPPPAGRQDAVFTRDVTLKLREALSHDHGVDDAVARRVAMKR